MDPAGSPEELLGAASHCTRDAALSHGARVDDQLADRTKLCGKDQAGAPYRRRLVDPVSRWWPACWWSKCRRCRTRQARDASLPSTNYTMTTISESLSWLSCNYMTLKLLRLRRDTRPAPHRMCLTMLRLTTPTPTR